MNEEQVYLRVKRRNQTFCLLCNASDTVAHVKREIVAAMSQHTSTTASTDGGSSGLQAARLRLLTSSNNDDDDKDQSSCILNDSVSLDTLSDDQVLYVVFPIGDDEWEAVDVTEMSEG